MNFPENPIIDAVKSSLGAGREIFLTGGSVRDLILQRETEDFDFVMEGDIMPLAEKVAVHLDGKLVRNKKLMTATLATPWGTVDFASARKEYYKYPGALPIASPAGINEDLSRRDFTINTLLLPLSSSGWGELRDLLGGLADIKKGLIRFLHPESFRDDPTRILRALRFKNRLGFKLEGETRFCLQRDWPCLNNVSPARRFKELVLVCREENLGGILEDVRNLGGWNTLFGSLAYNPDIPAFVGELKGSKDTRSLRVWFLVILILLIPAPELLEQTASYWGLNGRDRKALEDTIRIIARQDEKDPLSRKLFRLLKTLPPESAYYIYKTMFSRDFSSWREFYAKAKEYRLPVRGEDLQKLGMKPGRELGRVLAYLEARYLEGAFDTREEGLILAAGRIKEEC